MRSKFCVFILFLFAVTLVKGQKQLILKKQLNDSSFPKVLEIDNGYFVAFQQREYYSGVNYNTVVYLSRFDECDNELWTSKLITPLDYFALNHMDYFSDNTILIALSKSDGTLFLMEIDLNGEVRYSNLLNYQINNCERFHLNYIENNRQGDYYITGFTSCSNAEASSYFIRGSRTAKALKGKVTTKYSNDTHIKFLNEEAVLGQVGEHYFRMNGFDDIEWQFKLNYLQEQNLFLSYQPLIQGNDVYLLVEKTYTNGFVLKFDLSTQTILWKSDLFEYNLPIRINATDENLVTLNSRFLNQNLVINIDKSNGKTQDAYLINEEGSRYRGMSIALENQNNLYVYEGATGNLFYDPIINIVLNAKLDSCLIKEEIILEINQENINVENDNLEIFDEEFDVQLLDTSAIIQSYLDTILYKEDCSHFSIIEIIIDTSIECGEVLLLDQFYHDLALEWEDGSTDFSRRFLESGDYSATISDCRNQYDLTLKLIVEECNYDIFIPNILARNSTKENDKLIISTSEELDYYNIMIYDRWGGLIFESKDPTEVWNTNEIPLGVYICKLEFQLYGMEQTQLMYQSLTVVD